MMGLRIKRPSMLLRTLTICKCEETLAQAHEMTMMIGDSCKTTDTKAPLLVQAQSALAKGAKPPAHPSPPAEQMKRQGE